MRSTTKPGSEELKWIEDIFDDHYRDVIIIMIIVITIFIIINLIDDLVAVSRKSIFDLAMDGSTIHHPKLSKPI